MIKYHFVRMAAIPWLPLDLLSEIKRVSRIASLPSALD